MATEAQIKANRRNAQHSTGPKTEEGKAASSQNSQKFALACRNFHLLEFEDESQLDLLTDRLLEDYQPKTAVEKILVLKMAQHHWCSQRAFVAQDMCFGELYKMHREDSPATLKLMLRYQAEHDRAFHKCVAELRAIGAGSRQIESHQIRSEQHPMRQRLLAVKVANAESLRRRKTAKESPDDPQLVPAPAAPPVTVISDPQSQAA